MERSPARRYSPPMTAEDVKSLPVERKIQIMEALWEDLLSTKAFCFAVSRLGRFDHAFAGWD